MPRAKRTTASTRTNTAPPPLITRPGPHAPAEFTDAKRIGDFAILGWHTAVGTIGLAHSVADTGGGAHRAADALYATHWDHMHQVYNALVVVGHGLSLDQAPQLEAVDIMADTRLSEVYEPTWRQLADLLGIKAPWFHHYLRDPAAILAWRPGQPPAQVAADDPTLPTAPLALLALDEPPGSPAGMVCDWLARTLRRRAFESAAKDIAELADDEHELKQDCAHVGIGAVPLPIARHDEPDEPGQMIKLAGWAQITERRDTLADAVANTVLWWDGGKDWPTGESVELYPDQCPIAAAWIENLEPDPGDLPPTVAERRLLDARREHEDPQLLHDAATAAPAVARTDHDGALIVTAACAQRLPTVSPLAEVILSHGAVWIRTEDGGLYLAPNVSGVGLSWGYGGGGPAALANLLDKLLDDITAPAVRDYGKPPAGLRQLIASTLQADEPIRYTRDQLLTARTN